MRLQLHNELEEGMKKTIEVLRGDLNGIRAGRANPALLDKIMVNYYGTATPLKQIASVSAPEPRLLVIQPYDVSAIQAIEKAITQSELGINPANDGKIIRLAIPQLTEERRKELNKLVRKIGEESKIALRNQRRDANDKIKKMEKDSEISEDDLKKAENEVQKITDKYVETVEDMIVKKEEEMLEV